jgi:hydrogenase maturation protease
VADRVLVAGIGNLFLSDDGFGPEVVRRLAQAGDLPGHVKVVDYGIRGMHLAYDLLDGYRALVLVDVLVDALPGTGAAGEITVLEVGQDDLGAGDFDPHGMAPVAVLASVHQLGGTLPPTYVVGCRPETVEEGIGLSEAVSAAVAEAVVAVKSLLDQRLAP